uniref:DDRGK domain containing 1 n=1 Tax=Catharus ustulatus TaxID=91951 RepID=A0A8C3U225_CATUS
CLPCCCCSVALAALCDFFFFLFPSKRVLSEEEDAEEVPEFQVSGKIGAKKQRKLEEKQARKAQREVRISCHVLSRAEEEKRKAKEEEEKREYEEYLKLKESFVVEEEGVEEAMTEEQVRGAGSALSDLLPCLVLSLPSGVIDDRGKFIYITAQEMAAVAQYIKQRGRVSIAELAQASNSLINLQPDSRAVPPTVA